jgi:hypothetical protein
MTRDVDEIEDEMTYDERHVTDTAPSFIISQHIGTPCGGGVRKCRKRRAAQRSVAFLNGSLHPPQRPFLAPA